MNIGSDINIAANCLNKGKLVAIPTETVYGLAANAFNPEAVAHIYTVKNRPAFNPLIIHSNSLKRFENWGIHLPEKALKLANHFSPGPLTYVVPKSDIIPLLTTAGNNSVAIRIPNHALTLELLSNLEFPLAAPSANPSGYISPTNALHVAEQLGHKVDYILDGGNCKVGLESTILSFLEPKVKLLRLGGLAIEEIENVLGEKIEIGSIQNNENPLAPGMLSRHYAPKTKLVIGNLEDYFTKYPSANIGTITFKTSYLELPTKNQFVLALNGNLETAAANLFLALREIDKLGLEIIVAESFPNYGLGLAINDRLKRASIN